MGQFHVSVDISTLEQKEWKHFPAVMIDTGSEATWLPEKELRNLGIKPKGKRQFRMADGHVVTRDKGYAIIRSGYFETVDTVIFAKPNDHLLLGAHTMDGFHAIIDPVKKKLLKPPYLYAHGIPPWKV